MEKIICIVGPTASGKTAFSIELAQYLMHKGMKACIINADSRQLYADFPIITAQPTKEEQAQVPHSLYSILQSSEKSNAGFWLKKVDEEIKKCVESHTIPILVGGTGMYIKSLTEGIAQIPQIPQDVSTYYLHLLQSEGIESLYAKLQVIDEQYANKIHKNDKQRILRALEVYHSTGKCISLWHKEAHEASAYTSYKIGIGMPLDELTPYLYKRTQLMLENHAIEEAKQALIKCPDTQAPAWTGIGCKELALYLQEEIDLNTACELWNKNTRAYAKRQWTWFRGDKAVHWCHPLDKEKRALLIQEAENFMR